MVCSVPYTFGWIFIPIIPSMFIKSIWPLQAPSNLQILPKHQKHLPVSKWLERIDNTKLKHPELTCLLNHFPVEMSVNENKHEEIHARFLTDLSWLRISSSKEHKTVVIHAAVSKSTPAALKGSLRDKVRPK